jgi:tetratricopeptide (TPR) repeat protein
LDNIANEAIKPKLHQIVALGRAAQQEILAHVGAAEQAALGTEDHWAVKDTLVHLAMWKRHSARRVRAALAGETLPKVDDFQAVNEQTFAAHRLQPWDAVVAESEQADADLLAAIDACPDDLLTNPHAVPALEGQPLWTTVIGNGYLHPIEHLVSFYLERGDLARATAAQQATVDTARQLFGADSSAYSNAVYNLGCFYAKAGQAAPAIAAVGEALHLNPDLVEWSKQDSDLDSVRADPAFQALYASNSGAKA